MILSRNKASVANNQLANLNELRAQRSAAANQDVPTVLKFVSDRDFIGCITLLEHGILSGVGEENADLWLAYCLFHNGDYKKSLQKYLEMDNQIYAACCYFYLGMYTEAKELLRKAPASPLKVRLSFQLAHQDGDETEVMEHHKGLRDVAEDQLCLAAIHYLRSNYQDAIDIYKRLVLQNKDMVALHVYIALCYYKLDFYDVSQEVLSVYLQKNQDSLIAINLKACNIYRLYNGRAAETEIRTLMDSLSNCSFGRELLEHNLVIFRNGEGALQVLPVLLDVIPEAKLNLITYYLRQDELKEALRLIQDVEPTLPVEYILKGTVYTLMGQETNNKEYIDIAIKHLHLVGSSSSECDTIPGRQCVATAYFLQQQYDDVLLYMNSIKSYLGNDDTFKFNFALVKTILGHYKEAEEDLLVIQKPQYRTDYTFLECLTRCLIMNRKAAQAWDIYNRMETSAESLGILHLLANDCYRTGQFLIASKAFDVLDKYDPSAEHADAKRGACVGTFRMILAGKEDRQTRHFVFQEVVNEILPILRASADPQTNQVLRVITNWAKENRTR
uniref:EOG090X04LA n=1 Tax=Evadne anonyx TaxID=141404 RepID=A0A9N6WUJ4_9CRUS|nr:EOG090X04LA [Evadne anonyx]